MSHFIHTTVTVHLLWAHLSDKRNKMKSKSRIYANHEAQTSKCRTNLGAIIKSSVKLYFGGFKEIRSVFIYLNILNFKTDL